MHTMTIIFKNLKVLNLTIEETSGLGIDSECIGGGRVNIKENEKSILVYGYSQGI